MNQPANELGLHEELLLIALRDEAGTPESRAGMIDLALGGALLAELALAGRVKIANGKRNWVELAGDEPLGDELLDECLGRIAGGKRPRQAGADWVSRFAAIKKLRLRIAQSLCRRGILQDSEARVLLVFKRKAYPTIDPEPERRLLDRMRRAIELEEEVDPRTAALIALANSTGMLKIHFDKALLKQRQQHLQDLASGQAIAGAVRGAVEAAQAAILAAATAASVAATTAGSH